jgi:LVIVD repeat-containing protein
MRFPTLVLSAGLLALAPAASAQTTPPSPTADPRVGLGAGWPDAKEAIRNLELVAHRPRPEGFFDPAQPGNFDFANSDLAFSGHYVFQGGWHGIQIWDIAEPAKPTLKLGFVCPGGQGDLSVYKNLLVMSVQDPGGRVDCGTQGTPDSISTDRLRGVRIFDITDLAHPKQVAAVQTCRGSHTHTLVTDPNDPANVYIYVSGTSPVRPVQELAGCSGGAPQDDPNTAYFRIDVIKVPLAAPEQAKIVGGPRIFADSAGAIAGLWKGGDHGPGTQTTTESRQCHDITVYSALGLAAGACSGNGLLLDIRDPANPKRIAEVSDPNFAFWHSATFNNDGTKVLFTDEWGGGTQPRCRATDRPEWGADAIFTRTGDKMKMAGYFKLPAPQTDTENCVAHNGSLIPVPGRDIMVQGWYQGGLSVFDFTDPAHPVEIAFFDRGPYSDKELMLGGYWAGYWYNGHIYGTEIGRGLDIFSLLPSEYLSKNEIEAARLVRFEQFNPQNQPRFVWPARFVVARAYLDQLLRADGLRRSWVAPVALELDRAEKLTGAPQKAALTALAAKLDKDAQGAGDPAKVRALAAVVRELGGGK